MDTQYLSSRNLRSLLILLVLCGSLVNGAFTLRQDTWLAVLLMGILFLPIVLIYIRISRLYPGKGFFDIIASVFGPLGQGLFTLLFVLYALVVGSLVLQNFTVFTVVIALRETPNIPIMILILIASFYLAQKGPKVLGRWSLIICTLIICNFLITLFLSSSIMRPSYIFPVLDHSFGEIAHNAYAIGCIAVGETLMVLTLFGYTKKEQHPARVYLPGILIGVSFFILIILRNLFVLGPSLEQNAQFSTYMSIRVIKVGSFLERLESSIAIIYILLGITKLTLLLIAAAMGTARLFNGLDYKSFLMPIGLLTLAIGALVFNNVMEMYDFVWVYSYLCLPFQVILPLILWITAELKVKQLRS